MNILRDPELLIPQNLRQTVIDPLLNLILRPYDLFRLFLRYRKGALIDLMVLGERDLINLHGDRRNQIRRLPLPDKCMQRADIHRIVRDNVSRPPRQRLQP